MKQTILVEYNTKENKEAFMAENKDILGMLSIVYAKTDRVKGIDVSVMNIFS